MDMLLGKLFIYSLKTDLKINWKEFFDEAKLNEVLDEFIPIQKGKNRINGTMGVKEIRRNIINVAIKCFYLSIRENGGVLFIPKDKLDEWTPYETTLLCFPGIEVACVDVIDTAENRQIIIKALLNETKEKFKEEIHKLDGSENIVGNLKELSLRFMKASSGNKLKIDATNYMYNRLLEMRRKVIYYEGLTNVDCKYINAHISNAIKVFEKVYKARQEEKYVANW